MSNRINSNLVHFPASSLKIKKNYPEKTSYILEWSLISPIAQTICVLWNISYVFRKKNSSLKNSLYFKNETWFHLLLQTLCSLWKNCSYFPAPRLKKNPWIWEVRYIQEKFFHIWEWLLIKPKVSKICHTLGWLLIKQKNYFSLAWLLILFAKATFQT